MVKRRWNGEEPSTLAELVQQYRKREADSDRLLQQILEKVAEDDR